MWRRCLRADVVILELNPRNLSTWGLLLSRRALRRPSILWGHAWSRSGPDGRADIARGLLRRLATVLLVYTESQASELQKRMPGQRANILAAPNALYFRAEMEENLHYFQQGGEQRTNFLYVGRLVEEKKPDLLVRAFLSASERLGTDSKLLIVGDGPMRPRLEQIAREHPRGGQVQFLGHVSAREKLRDYYQSTIACVSPSYAGLSLTQSFSFGVPMLIADKEAHSPEIEAAQEGKNCLFFPSNSEPALAEKLLQLQSARAQWEERGPAIIAHCSQEYSIDQMVSRFVQAADLSLKKCS